MLAGVRLRLLLASFLPLAVALTGCGGEEATPDDGAAAIGDPADALRCGDRGVALETDAGRTAGPEGVHRDARTALEAYLAEAPDAPDVALGDLVPASEQVGTVLYVRREQGRPVLALVVADGMRDRDDRTGWAVRATAACGSGS